MPILSKLNIKMKRILLIILCFSFLSKGDAQNGETGICRIMLGEKYEFNMFVLDSAFFEKPYFNQFKKYFKKKSSRKVALNAAVASQWGIEMNTAEEIYANRQNLSNMYFHCTGEMFYQNQWYKYVEFSMAMNRNFPKQMLANGMQSLWVRSDLVIMGETGNVFDTNLIIPYLKPGEIYRKPKPKVAYTEASFYQNIGVNALNTLEEKISFLMQDYYYSFAKTKDTADLTEGDGFSNYYGALVNLNELEYAYVEEGEGILTYSSTLLVTESKDSALSTFAQWQSFLEKYTFPFPMLSYEPWSETDSSFIVATWYRTIGEDGAEDDNNGLYLELVFRELPPIWDEEESSYDVIFLIKKPE